MDVQGGSVGKESTCNAGDLVLIPGLGSSPGEGNCNPLQCSCLENPMDREAWQAIGYGVTRRQEVKRGTRLSNYTTTILYKFQVNNIVIHNF